MIIGHQKILARLKKEALSGRMGHAQLFIGPQHVGKTRVAMEIAILLQNAADKKLIRQEIFSGVSADTIFLTDEGQNISIKDIRTLKERASQSHASPYLVMVIENVARMKIEAMNALLKTLEEPCENTIFFLTANQEDHVLPTIRSRCRVTHFNCVSDETILKALKSTDPKSMLMYAMGRPGKLIRLQKDMFYFELHCRLHEIIESFLEKPCVSDAFALSRKYEKDEYLEEFLDILLHRTRTLILSGRASTDLAEKIEESREDLRGNVNRKLVLENLLLSFVL